MAKAREQKTKAEIYREERKKRIAKQQKKQAKITAASRKRHRIFKRICLTILVVLLVLAITASIIFATGIPNRYLPAVKIGNHDISVSEYNYYYNTVVNNFNSQYGQYASMIGFDPNKPFDKQDASAFGEETFADYFQKQTFQILQTNIILNDLAKEENITLNEEDQTVIDSYMESLNEVLKEPNASMKQLFGKGSNKEDVKKYFTNNILAQRYGTFKRSTFKYSDAELEEYYQGNKDTYDVASYMSFTFASKADSEADEQVKKDALADAKKLADDMLSKVTDEKTFAEQAKINASEEQKKTYEDENAALSKDATKASVGSAKAADWIFDSARKIGDKIVIENENDCMVLYLVETKHRLDYKTVNIRHILIQPETDNENAPTAEQKAAAKQKAQDLYDTFKAGDMSEDSFIQLAKDNSDDPGSKANGGLYSGVSKGDMVEQFNDWCFDPSRKQGDSGIVETDYGYHIMYFSGYDVEKWKKQVETVLVDKAYDDFFNSKMDSYDIKENKFGLHWAVK